MNQPTGIIFDIQRFSLYDGPGIRTVVFLKGCPLHCAWCHNPEGLSSHPQILYRPDQCIGCGDCLVCMKGAHQLQKGIHIFDRRSCIGCGLCADCCPSGALALTGRIMDIEDVMKIVRADAHYYENEGGLTLSGGEPAMQTTFARALLDAAAAEGFHTAIETSGCVEFERLERLLPAVDLFLFDWKHSDAALLKQYTGADLERIRTNLLELDNRGKEVILRCPIIPGVNDNSIHLEGIAAMAAQLCHCTAVHLEPYHSIGLSKSAQLGVENPFTPPVPESAAMERMRQFLSESLSIPVVIS